MDKRLKCKYSLYRTQGFYITLYCDWSLKHRMYNTACLLSLKGWLLIEFNHVDIQYRQILFTDPIAFEGIIFILFRSAFVFTYVIRGVRCHFLTFAKLFQMNADSNKCEKSQIVYRKKIIFNTKLRYLCYIFVCNFVFSNSSLTVK